MNLAGELWEGLSPAESEQVASLCPERRFSKGGTIFAPGDPPDALYVLKSGLVTLSHLSEEGEQSILRVFGPGDVFGELLLTVTARPFLATALTDCVVTVMPGKTFLRLLSAIPRIGLNFIAILSRHLTEMALDRAQASHKWSLQRLALTLLKLGTAHGVADMIGTSRETVTRHLGGLKRRGIVRQQGRTLLIQPARLKALVPKSVTPVTVARTSGP